MKKTITTVAMITMLATSTITNAQKFGHLNSNELIMLMPERAQAQKDLEAYTKDLEAQLKSMDDDYKAKVADYQAKEATMTDAIKKTKVKEVTDLEARIKEFQGTAQTELRKKENDLMKPIIDKAKKAIDDVTKANKYTYIFETSQGGLLSKPDGDNVMPLVKKKLGITN